MAVSGSFIRILVHLRRTPRSTYQPAVFTHCVLGALGLDGEGQVECRLEDNKLLLQCPTSTSTLTTSYKLMHPPFCPCQELRAGGVDYDPGAEAGRGVAVGAAVLLEAGDGRLLLTRRAPHMRTFAKTWVPPGGHVEAGESLETAVLRELEEETGLKVTDGERQTCRILGLWESVFPPMLGMGDPNRQHVVVYLHVKLTRTAMEMQSQFKLCPDEVDAAVWLTEDLVRLAVWKDDTPWPEDAASAAIPVTLVNKDGDHAGGTIEASVLKESNNDSELRLERLSTGSRFALSLWLEQHLKDKRDKGFSQRDLYGKYMDQDRKQKVMKHKL